jgi:pyruvate-ferredoxin/flavodoxin oxidoreductase
MLNIFKRKQAETFKYPGVRAALDGNSAVIACERESSDAAGAYPITPSTQMGEYWAEATARGHLNISGRPLIFVEPEGEHAAAAVTAGMSMTGLRAANFSSGQGIAYMHESLYAAVGKRLTYVLNIGSRAMTKANLNVHAGHDDYHCIDDTGFFQLFARNAQHAADLNIIAHRIAELALTPGAVAQDGFLTTHLIESLVVPERALIAEYLGQPDDIIDTPTPAQRIIYGDKRRRIPLLWDVDNPVMSGLVQNQDAYMQSVAAQRPFFFDHIDALAARAFEEFHQLTGRRYAPVMTYKCDDADYLIVGQGSLIPSAEAVADYLRATRKLKVGVVDLVMFRPFPAGLLARVLEGRKGVTVLERLDQPLAVDLPLAREIRATLSKCQENGRDPGHPAFPDLPAFNKPSAAPPIYSGSFGLGSRDLQPEGLIGAVENMIDGGARKRFFYLSIDFLHDTPRSPKADLHQDAIRRAYPDVGELAVRGSENPNLMPKDSITVRFHSVGGWGAITTGKNLAMTLFDLLGYHIKANPKYGSEKKGQPTTYYLSAAPEPIRVNCEYFYVDVVLSPDPHVFGHTNALAGLEDGGTFIIQSDAPTPERVWASIPAHYQQLIRDKGIKVFYLDAFGIARAEATDADLQLRMQGIAFQGAFFSASPVLEQSGLDEAKLLAAIDAQIRAKFGAKGERVVQDNLRVVKRGFDEVRPVPHGAVGDVSAGTAHDRTPPVPVMVTREPVSKAPVSDTHRFWEQTGSFYARGMGSDQITDPFIGLGTMPAVTGLFRDMTGIRFEHPEWIPENCTACGDCYTVCPDTAIPGLVNEPEQIVDTIIARAARSGALPELQKRSRSLIGHLRTLFEGAELTDNASGMFEEALALTVAETGPEDDARAALERDAARFRETLGEFRFALTRPFYSVREQHERGSGGLLSITVNPYTCKGCMECVAVCGDDALRPMQQTDVSIQRLRDEWQLWLDLPTTPKKYSRVADLEAGTGALQTLLLDKRNYLAMSSGDGACLGCSEKTVIHLFVATVEALMQARVAAHVEYLGALIERLEGRIHRKLVDEMDIEGSAVARMVQQFRGTDLTLSAVAENLTGGDPIDQDWFSRAAGLLGQLKTLRWRYLEGTTGRGRTSMGMLNATGCSSVWGSTYPYNPYPFPWSNHLFQDSASIAMGVFEGHMAKMADGFRAIRLAEAEIADRPAEDLTWFNWRHFSDEEWLLCPPVVVVGGDGAMYDIGFQNLSRMLMSGKPIKALVLDTQVYSNTGGQACTSGFIGQVSDMAQYGKAFQGKEEIRKEIGLIGMAHRTSYVLQSSIAHSNHMISGFIEGLRARRPALFNLYTSCQPEHGIGDDKGAEQAKLAVEARAYPIFKYDPEKGRTPAECFDISGNPDPTLDWPTYTLRYREFKREKTMELPLTFADFALTEARFRKHFRRAPPDTWNEKMVPLAEFLDLDEGERSGRFPFVWTVDRKQQLGRLLVSSVIVASCEERRDWWTMLRALAGVGEAQPTVEDVEARVRQEVVGRIAAGLMQLAGGSSDEAAAGMLGTLAGVDDAAAEAPAEDPTPGEGYQAPWIETGACTSCDECIRINPQMFAYNAQKKAEIVDPNAGPYADLVKAAEMCTAGVIHPGVPRAGEADEALIARARPFN